VSDAQPHIYTDLAGWYHLLTAPDEYAEEAAFYWGCFQEAASGPLTTLLELGSGGGNNALHYKQWVTPTLTDLSPQMLQLSQTINPEPRHIQGDMRTLRLGEAFDAVFVHDAVDYMLTEADLRQAMETAFVHLRPGGVAVFAPDAVRETYKPTTGCGGHDGADGRSLRYLEWSFDPDPADTLVITDFVHVLREGDALPRTVVDRHLHGLFSRTIWLRLLAEVGFERVTVRPLVHSEVEMGDVEVFTAVRPR
jgi:SAM-dependent methyltransferase